MGMAWESATAPKDWAPQVGERVENLEVMREKQEESWGIGGTCS